jgi:LuxR family transcriptional regulator, maltose regulon positive regulatory protein
MPEARFAKFARPGTDGLLRRDRLFARLDAANGRPLVWISGPPGTGKTSLASSWIEERRLPCLWYQVDAGDADPAAFFYYFGMAVVAALGCKEAPPLFALDARDLAAFARRWFRDLFALVPDEFVLVFDNLHEADDNAAVQEIVAEATAQAPAGVHIIAISRFDPPARFAGQAALRRLTRIDWAELQFTREEAADLATALGVPSSANLGGVQDRVDGWAAGIVLLAESLRRAPVAAAAVSPAHLETIFEYFATLLFDDASADERDMLMRMSMLPNMTASMAQVITGRTEAAKVLARMARRNLFVTRRPGAATVYEFHGLVRSFLRARARETLAEEEYRRLTASAAALLQTTGQMEDARLLFAETGNWEAYAELLCGVAPHFIRQGRRETLRMWFVPMPQSLIDAEPRLRYWLGVVRTASDPLTARDLLVRAFDGYASAGDAAGQLLAAAQIADSFYSDGTNWRPIDPWIDRIETLLVACDWNLAAEPAARAAASLLRARLFRCPQDAAMLERLEQVSAKLDAIRDPDLLLDVGTALMAGLWWRGDADGVERLIARLQPVMESGRAEPRTRSIHLWWSALHAVHLIETERAMELFERGRTLVDDSGMAPLSREFERGQIAPLVQAGKFGMALAQLEQRIRPHLEGGSLHLRLGYYLHSAQSHLGLRDAERALDLVKRAEALCESSAYTFYRIIFGPVLGRILIALRRPDEARAEFERTLALIGEHGSPWMRGNVLIGLAHALLEEGDRVRALETMQAGFAALRRTRYFWGSAWYSTYEPTVLMEALRHHIEPEYVQHLIRHRAIGCPEPDFDEWPWTLRVRAFGTWRVDVHGSPARGNGGKSGHRLSDLLKALVALGPDPIDARLLADTLWPDSEADAGVNSLQVAVYRLRKWLKREDALVVADGTLRLDASICWVDVWAFDRGIERLRTIHPGDTDWEAMAMRVLALYRGSLFAHELTQSWMLAPRDQRHRSLLWLARRLGDQFERRGAVNDAIQLYQRVLDIDPVAEELYQRLMACQSRAGNRTEALDTYRRCREQLAASLAVAPSGETERLHLALRAGG